MRWNTLAMKNNNIFFKKRQKEIQPHSFWLLFYFSLSPPFARSSSASCEHCLFHAMSEKDGARRDEIALFLEWPEMKWNCSTGIFGITRPSTHTVRCAFAYDRITKFVAHISVHICSKIFFVCWRFPLSFRIIHTFIHLLNFDAFPFPFLFFCVILFPYPFRNAPENLCSQRTWNNPHSSFVCWHIFLILFPVRETFTCKSHTGQKQILSQHTHTFECLFFVSLQFPFTCERFIFIVEMFNSHFLCIYFEVFSITSNEVCTFESVCIHVCARVYRKYIFTASINFLCHLLGSELRANVSMKKVSNRNATCICCCWYWKMTMKMK